MTERGITKVVFEEKTFEWEIQNYSNCNLLRGSALRSPSFSVGPHGFSTWHLLLYPEGENGNLTNDVSIKIVLEECRQLPLNVEVLFKATGLTRSRETSKTKYEFKEIGKCFGCSQFLKKYLEHNYSNLYLHHYLTDNKLKISCTLIVVIDRVNVLETSLSNIIPKNYGVDNLSRDFQTLWETETSSDFTINAGTEKLPVHKAILAARSPVFRSLINHDMKEKNENSMIIQDVDCDVVKEMLRYIYTGKVENLEIVAYELLKLSEKYQLEELKNICGGTLGEKLDIDNAIDLLILADLYRIEILKKHILNFIAYHVNELIEKEKFKPLHDSSTYHSLYDEIMSTVAMKSK